MQAEAVDGKPVGTKSNPVGPTEKVDIEEQSIDSEPDLPQAQLPESNEVLLESVELLPSRVEQQQVDSDCSEEDEFEP